MRTVDEVIICELEGCQCTTRRYLDTGCVSLEGINDGHVGLVI